MMLGLANPRVGFESGVLWVAVHDPVVMALSTSFLAAAMAVKWRFPRGRGSAQMFARAGTFPARTFSCAGTPPARMFSRAGAVPA